MRVLGGAAHPTSQKVLQEGRVELGQLFDWSMPHTCALFHDSATMKKLRKN